MRICFLGDGNSIHIKRWVNYFKDRGHEVYLITFSNVEIKDVTVYTIGKVSINEKGGNWIYLLNIYDIKKTIKKIKPDVISAHYVTSYGFIASLLNLDNVAVTAWGSDVLVTAKTKWYYRLITKHALNKAKLVTVDADFLNEEVQKLSNTRVITVPMGVNGDLCYKEKTEPIDQYSFVSLRNLIPNSNVDIIIRAFAKLVKENEKCKLYIGNEGTERKVNRINKRT